MSHKSTPAGGDLFAIPDHAVLALEGPGAAKFAQAQFMNDVAALAPGHWQWSGWLTPKGRAIALFALLKRDEERLWLLLADAAPAGFVEALGRFVFRSKVRIRIATELRVSGTFSAPAQAHGATFARNGDGFELDFGTATGARTLAVGETPAVADAEALARWNAFDLAHGRPRLDATQAGQWTPQQLSLERLRGYSVSKGCYPGQEIVARTHFLGQAKRGLARLACAAEVAAGSAVMADGRELGRVVCSQAGELLAVLPVERAEAALAVDGAPCEPRPLLDGLAR
ncbi:folate-binding protein [Luteimonas sp. RD2P54]|uniref:Folate-binding protein n=1 Tax=Luteimonas endophytica TaxID=3042023 RepID=A0ABT6JC19_9GAMM|nr:folate-binding protein [Luteimonas endophytica]MDH5824370.1 folate-binding protein [Luteimonas endophytica]